ncbi:hypothetical protein F4802DRAFT_559291 [Xylaria palmicola]|nr:hypothetical protein F4802DRAFT_559291 [Xylaria palmicola]
MSTPRAIRPLLGVSSRLVDQFIPRSAATARIPKKLFSSSASPATALPPISICWGCRHGSSPRRQQQQLRFSSSTPKPPDHDRKHEYESQPTPPFDPPDFSPPSSHSTSTSTSTSTDAANVHTQEAEAVTADPSRPGQEQDRSPPPPPPPSSSDPDLPSALNSRRSALNQSLSMFMDRAQTTLFAASQRINHLTGYSSIESLKTQISTLEAQLHAAQAHLTATRGAYKSAVSDRAATQREVTTLLARQKTWTPLDFERFTSLYRQDYELEASVGERAAELEQAEREAERLGRELGAGILARYHEEQIWSDKIRRMSTWGTWGLMGVNILLFLLLQFGAEPWRRRRLVRGFEEKVREALAEERTAREQAERVTAAAIAATAATPAPIVDGEAGEQEPVVVAAPDVAVPESDIISTPEASPEAIPIESDLPAPSWREALTSPAYWRSAVVDLVSDRKIALRMRDVSLIAVESAVAGAAIVGALAILLFRRT